MLNFKKLSLCAPISSSKKMLTKVMAWMTQFNFSDYGFKNEMNNGINVNPYEIGIETTDMIIFK